MNNVVFVRRMAQFVGVFLCWSFSQSTVLGQVYCVRAGASGSNNGSDWNNAYSSLPATLQRGAVYYVADGTYPSYKFDDRVSGTSLITIKKATGSDHGVETGWVSSYGDDQAVWNGPLTFTTGYYVLDGQYRDEGNWTNGAAYGFKIANNGQDQQVIVRSDATSGTAVSLAFRYIFADAIFGNLPASTIRRYAFDFDRFDGTGAYTGVTIQRCYVFGGNNTFFLRNTTGALVEYCAAFGARNNNANHAEIWNLYYSGTDATIRYNICGDFCIPGNGTRGTAVVAITLANGLKFYGNVVDRFAVGDAVVGYAGYSSSNNRIFNNTFIDGDDGNRGLHFGTGTNNLAYNNLWINCGMVNFTSVTHDYNGFSDTNTRSEAHSQINIRTTIFSDYLNNSHLLTAATQGGDPTIGSEYGFDMKGNARGVDGVWDRGAFEYTTGTTDTVPPVISNPGASSITSTNAAVSWVTDEPSSTIVEYGATVAYGLVASNSAMVTSHSLTLSSLAPDALLNYRVRSVDASGNASTSGNLTLRTLGQDLQPPQVSLTSPADAAIVSGVITLSATANDNVGIANVRFYLGTTTVNEDLTIPYSFSWDSRLVPNGSYSICARAVDGSGNAVWSSTNVIAVNNEAASLPPPAAYWNFDEGSGSTSRDLVSTKQLSLQNGMAWNTVGKFGSALSLDGVNDYGDASTSSVFDLGLSTMSVAIWVNLQNQNSWQQIVAKVKEVGAFTPPFFAWHLFGAHVSTTQWRPQFQLANEAQESVNVSSSINVNYGEWVHLVGVYDGTAVRIYVNGVEYGSAPQSGATLKYNQPFYVGAHGLPGEFMKGQVDELRLYSTALSALEVQALYFHTPQIGRPEAPSTLRFVEQR